jgi:hypothetical protein
MATEQVLEGAAPGPRYRAWLSPILFLLAVTLILSTLYNQEMIVDWLVGIQSEAAGPEALWAGPVAGVYDTLQQELEGNLPTEEEALAAADAFESRPAPGGLYVLFSEGVYVGAANVLIDEQGFHFAALLASGEEIRGRGELERNYYILVPENGGIRERRRVSPIQGVASPQADGTIECVGDDLYERFSCMAYPFQR